MRDEEVRAALRSDAALVVVEAPAGCGKTHQGADFAREIAAAAGSARVLILTHTHAACSMFSERTKGAGSRVEIRTIDSVIAQIAGIYHAGIGLPADIAAWVRQQKSGHARLAAKVSGLLQRHSMIAAALARRYPFVICDEHQDSSADQHSVAMALLERGARVRIFADPMQKIFKESGIEDTCAPYDWDGLKQKARCEELDYPHRWTKGCGQLGQWILSARDVLKAGGRVDLKNGVPASISVIFAENRAQQNLGYRLSAQDRKPVDSFVNGRRSLLVLTRHNETARSLRGFFNRRVPLWEGHMRCSLEKLVESMTAANGDCGALAAAVVEFMRGVGKGFSPSAFGNRFEREAQERCKRTCHGKPATLQELARFIVREPDHRGVAKMLSRLWDLKGSDGAFADVEVDCEKEFWDAVRLGDFPTIEDGLAEITHRRTYSRPRPADVAISTIHKAKGLECESAIIVPCDRDTFPDQPYARCLLYVALSRAKSRLMFVVSRNNPSPLLQI